MSIYIRQSFTGSGIGIGDWNVPLTVPRGITNIDTDNNVQAGQSVVINTVVLELPIVSVTLGGEALPITGTPTQSAINVSIPAFIDLEWNTADNDLVVTDQTGALTLSNVTLSAPTGWETVVFDGTIPDLASTSSYYEGAIDDLGYTALTGDILAFTSSTGLTVNESGLYPTIDPPATSTGSYKFWSVGLQGWTSERAYTWVDGGNAPTKLITQTIDLTPWATAGSGGVVRGDDKTGAS